jgi:hypothetical protein
MPQSRNVSDLKELLHEYLTVIANANSQNNADTSLRSIRGDLRCSHKRLTIALRLLRAEGSIDYSDPKARTSTPLKISVFRPAPGMQLRVPRKCGSRNSSAILDLNVPAKANNRHSQPDLASELKASFFSSLRKNSASFGVKNIENANCQPVNSLNVPASFITTNTISNCIESSADYVPERVKTSAAVEPHEIVVIENLLKKLYREIFRCSYWRLVSHRDITCAEKIIENCKSQNWDLEDFLHIQFDWYSTVAHRRPFVNNLCGISAMERYDNWLRQEGYQSYAADEALVTNVEQRNRDLLQMRYTRAGLEHDERYGLLQYQFDAKLSKHIDEFTAKLTESEIKRYAKLVCDERPSWLVASLTQADIRELAIRRAVVEEKERLRVPWRRRHEELYFYEDLIWIEKETGEPSPQLRGVDLEKAGVQSWLIEIHEAICLKAQATGGNIRRSVS